MFKQGPYGGKVANSRYGEPPLAPGPIVVPPLWSFWAPLNANGFVFDEQPTTDLHIVVDDAGGATWASRVGSFVAAASGTPTVGVETLLYPQGGFAGTGYRTGMTCAAGYYELPYNAAHDITENSTVTYDLVLRTGDFVNSEIFVSHRDGVTFAYNLVIAAISLFGTPYIEARIQHTLVDAFVQYQCVRFGWYRLKMTYNGPTKTMVLSINGFDVGTSVAEGVPYYGAGEPLNIGSDSFEFPITTCQLVELQREQSIVATAPDWRNRCAKFWGVQDIYGVFPKIIDRYSQAGITVNNKIFKVGGYWLRMNQYGFPSEDYVINVLQNSTFSEGFGTGFGSGGATTYISDPQDNSSVGGNAVRVTNDNFGSFAGIYWTPIFVGAGTPCWLSIQWRALTAGANAYFLVYNSATGRYYDNSTQTWGVGVALNQAGTSSTDKVDFNLIFANDSSGGPLAVYVWNGYEVNTKQFAIFHVQFAPGYDKLGTPLVYESASGGNAKSNDNLQFDQAVINYSQGVLQATVTPISASTDPLSANQIYFGGAAGFLRQNTPSHDFVLTDGTNSAALPVTYVRGQALEFRSSWQGQLVNQELTGGSTASAAFAAPIDSGDLAIGGNNTGVLQPGAYLKNVRIK